MYSNQKATKLLFAVVAVLLVAGCAGNQMLFQIGFVEAGPGQGGNNEHPICQNSTNYKGWGDGTAITDPVWIADGPDSDSDPDKNEPVCYTRSKSGTSSKVRVEVTIHIEPASSKFSLIGMDGTIEYFRKDNIISTGKKQIVSVIASVNLPTNVALLNKTINWRVIPTGQASGYHDLGNSSHKIYVVHDTPITQNVEGQSNKLTPKRLDFSVGAASGKSNLVDVAHDIAYKVATTIGGSYGSYFSYENPRWIVFARSVQNLDCHHRAALAASAFGIVGIKGYVHMAFATCYPVPLSPWIIYPNSTVNDYVSQYTNHRLKRRSQSGKIHRLIFLGNNFEGNLRIEDGSSDDGNVWWTIWPFKKHDTAKELFKWYAGSHYQLWVDEKYKNPISGSITLPLSHIANKPKIIGGPN